MEADCCHTSYFFIFSFESRNLLCLTLLFYSAYLIKKIYTHGSVDAGQ